MQLAFEHGILEMLRTRLGILVKQHARFGPYAIVVDHEMPHVMGAALVCYASPKTNLDNPLLRIGTVGVTDVLSVLLYATRNAIAIDRYVKSQYEGALILTSRQQLSPQTVSADLPSDALQSYALLNEALRIADAHIVITEDGTGLDSLIEFLSNEWQRHTGAQTDHQ